MIKGAPTEANRPMFVARGAKQGRVPGTARILAGPSPCGLALATPRPGCPPFLIVLRGQGRQAGVPEVKRLEGTGCDPQKPGQTTFWEPHPQPREGWGPGQGAQGHQAHRTFCLDRLELLSGS